MKLNNEGLPVFTDEDFLSDREIDKSIREIFPEWREIITQLARYHAAQANALLHEWLRGQPVALLVEENFSSNIWEEPKAGLPMNATKSAFLVGVRKLGEE